MQNAMMPDQPDPQLRAAQQFWLIQKKIAEANLELLDRFAAQQEQIADMQQALAEQAVQLDLYRNKEALRFKEANKDLAVDDLPVAEPQPAYRILSPSELSQIIQVRFFQP